MRSRRVFCRECEVSHPAADFYPGNIRRGDGTGVCKERIRVRRVDAYWEDPDAAREKDRRRSRRPERRAQIRASLRRQRARDPEKFNRKSREWAAANPEKRRAHVAVGNAVRAGKLKRRPCEGCGRKRGSQAHHDDYSKPLEVRWLCTRCHGREHRERNAAKRAA